MFMYRIGLAAAIALNGMAGLPNAVGGTCYSSAVPAPVVRQQTLVAVDLTTPPDARAERDFRQAVATAALQPGQRIVIYSFAGIASGEHLAAERAWIVEAPITAAKQIDQFPMRAFRQSQACVEAMRRQSQALAMVALDAVLKRRSAGFGRSEILYSLREILSTATPELSTRVLVYSDALQFGSGVSFYGMNQRPRLIDVKAELAKLKPSAVAAPLPAMGPLKVLWWGALAEGAHAGTNDRYYDSDVPLALQAYWQAVLTQWGASSVQFGRTVTDPKLAYLPLQ